MVDYDWLDDEGIGEAFCLTFVRDFDAARVLARFGVDRATIRSFAGMGEAADGPFDRVMVAGLVEDWVFVLEDNGFEGSRPEVLRAVSADTEAVSVFTNVNGKASFHHALNGVVRTAFDPSTPARRWGGQPDALLASMREVGLSIVDDGWCGEGVAAALRLADRISGFHLTAEALAGPLVSGRLVPLLSDPSPLPSWMLLDDHELMTEIETAHLDVLRLAVAAEARRLASEAGIADEPPVMLALAAVERGDSGTVPDHSDLGLLLRGLAVESQAAGDSLAPPTLRHRMTEAQRQGVFLRHTAGLAVQAALHPDPRRAAYRVFGWVAPARDPRAVARRTQILTELRG